jgi:hypothetical protein
MTDLSQIALEIFNEGVFDDPAKWDEWERKLADKERRASAREEAKDLLRYDDNKYGSLAKIFNKGSEWRRASVDQLRKWMKLNPGFYITVVDTDQIGSGTRVPPIKITEPINNSFIPRQIKTFNRGEKALGYGRKGSAQNIKFKDISNVSALKKYPDIITFNFDEMSPSGANRHSYRVLVTPKMPSEETLIAFNPTGKEQYKETEEEI